MKDYEVRWTIRGASNIIAHSNEGARHYVSQRSIEEVVYNCSSCSIMVNGATPEDPEDCYICPSCTMFISPDKVKSDDGANCCPICGAVVVKYSDYGVLM